MQKTVNIYDDMLRKARGRKIKAKLEEGVADRQGQGEASMAPRMQNLRRCPLSGSCMSRVGTGTKEPFGSLCFVPGGGLLASVSSCPAGSESWKAGDIWTEDRCSSGGPGGVWCLEHELWGRWWGLSRFH